jgi:autotransporter-associated beta strand protein
LFIDFPDFNEKQYVISEVYSPLKFVIHATPRSPMKNITSHAWRAQFYTALAVAFLVVFLVPNQVRAAIASFPTAVGFGAATTGGRGGSIYHVTNLNDSGTGSFRDAVSKSSRIIVFDVGGSIHILSPVSTQSGLTIAGQTAPGGGIQIYGAEVSFYGKSNIICRYVHFRDGTDDPNYPGPNGTQSSTNAINLGSTNNTIFDHCSFEFAAYNNVDATGCVNLTIQNCIFANPIREQQFNGHFETGPQTFLANLWANSHGRNPLAKGNNQYINNVVYNYQYAFCTGNSSGHFSWDILNNYFIAGPSTTSANDDFYQVDTNQSAYATGNILDGNKDGTLNGSADNSTGAVVLSTYWASAIVTISGGGGTGATAVVTATNGGAITGITVTNGGTGYSSAPTVAIASTTGGSGATATATVSGGVVTAINITAGGTLYIPTTALPTLSTNATYYSVVSNAGPQPHDQVDSLVASNVVSLGHSGGLWSSQTATGFGNDGYGVIAGGTAPIDSDQDGMPDDWETAKGLNPNSAADANTTSSTGYTNIEDYINWMAQPHFYIAKNSTSQPTSVSIDLSQYAAAFPSGSTYTISGLTGGTVTQSGTGGNLVKFVPTLNTGPIIAGFNWKVTSGSNSYSGTVGILVSQNALPNNLLWKGDGTANNWDTTTSNWTNVNTSAASTYSGGDFATFDDTGSASPAVSLNGTLSPGSLTVNASTNNYTFSGTGSLTGTFALTKDGAGTLTVGTANTFSGGTNFQGGTTVISSGGNLGSGPIVFGDGTVLTSNYGGSTAFTMGNTLNVAAGNTATINMSGRMAIGGGTGGGTLNVNVPGTNGTFEYLYGAWSTFTGTLNITGTVSGAVITTRPNGGGFDGGLGGAVVNLDNVSLLSYDNSGGNTTNIGALSGTATASLGGVQFAGPVTYNIGALNTNTTFAGPISNGSGSLLLNKVGTGTLTLTGSNSYSGATNVNAGTLQMNGTQGATAVTVASGATLGINGSIGGLVTVSSGGFLYLGNFTAAGSVGTLSITGTAGFTLAGGGTVVFDLSNSPTGSNDQITVAGGNMTFSGTTNYQVNLTNNALGAGTYHLINGNATQQGSTQLNLIMPVTNGTTRQTFALGRPAGGTTPGFINLNVTGNAGALTWIGTNGPLSGLNLTNGGSGYTSAPTVTISGGGGTGATATATVLNGVVTGITITNIGSGYTNVPTVTISGGGGSGAVAAATVGGGWDLNTSANNWSSGSGYTSAPTVTITGGNGTGATATAAISGGGVTGFTITNGGSGYTTVPTVTITGGGGSGAVATATINGGAVTGVLVGFFNLDNVTFDDSSTDGSVVLTGTLAPSVFTLNNTNTAYTFSGSGLIGGNTQIIKNGSGTATFSTTGANTFTDGITINAGTLVANEGMGNSLITLNGGTLTLGSGLYMNNAILVNASSTIIAGKGSTAVNGGNATPLTSSNSGVTLFLSIDNGNTFSLAGDMSGFNGTISLGTSQGTLRLNYGGSGNTGSSGTLFDLGTSAYLGNRNGGVTINLGALQGGVGTTLQGRTSGGGTTATNYLVGALNTNTTFAGTIATGGDQLGTNITKVGTGNWTLSGTSNWLGIVTVQAGTLTISGSLNNGNQAFEAQTGSTLALSSGTITTNLVEIDAGATLTGCGTIIADLQVDGAASFNCGGTTTVSGDITNNGTMSVTNGSTLVPNGNFTNNGTLTVVSGSLLSASGAASFINNGVLDLLTSAASTLPAGFVNNGSVIYSSNVAVQTASKSGTNFTLTILSFSGHNYQLQSRSSLTTGTWNAVGGPQGGMSVTNPDGTISGTTLTFTDNGGATGGAKFYRIQVSP